MRLLSLSGLAALLPLTASAATVTLYVGPSHHLSGNGGAGQASLPSRTHATLSALGAQYTAHLTPSGEFVFRNVSGGSYLADVHCPTFAFAPIRVDVAEAEAATSSQGEKAAVVQAWETYRGNEWGNKGEVVAKEDGRVEARVLGVKGYYVERQQFSIFSILKNPMILLGLVSMGLFVGMPYLVENMDPEMKAEFEERQKSSPMNNLLAGQASGANPMGNFDMAAFLAGSNKKEGSGRGADDGVVRR